MSENRKPLQILLVEDNPIDAFLVKEILQLWETPNVVNIITNATDALSYLRQGNWATSRRPDMILLDLNLPGTTGCEMLAEVKTDPFIWDIPVCILTASADTRDVQMARTLKAAAYLTKPLDLSKLEEVIGQSLFGKSPDIKATESTYG